MILLIKNFYRETNNESPLAIQEHYSQRRMSKLNESNISAESVHQNVDTKAVISATCRFSKFYASFKRFEGILVRKIPFFELKLEVYDNYQNRINITLNEL